MKKIVVIALFVLAFAFTAFAQDGTAAGDAAKTSTRAKAFRPTKAQIKQGQEILIREKLYTGEATGVYGESRPAIKAYQKANGLEETGKFDKPTLEKMGIELTDSQKGIEAPAAAAKPEKAAKPKAEKPAAAASTDGPKRPAPFTATKEQIQALQKVLIAGKMFAGEANGERSDALKDAVKKYQEANSLKVTGGINAQTLEKAGIALNDKQKEQVAAQAAYDASKKPAQ